MRACNVKSWPVDGTEYKGMIKENHCRQQADVWTIVNKTTVTIHTGGEEKNTPGDGT